MSSLNVDEFAKHIFGTTENLTKIQKLFALLECCNQCQVSRIMDGKPFGPEISIDEIELIHAELHAEIDVETPDPDSPDYIRFIAMKGVVLTNQCFNLENARRALTFLEPFKTKPETALLYLTALLEVDRLLQNDKNIEYLLKADEFYEYLMANKIQFLSPVEIFGGIKPPPGFLIDDARATTLSMLFRKLVKLQDETLKLKYVLSSLKARFYTIVFIPKSDLDAKKFEEMVPGFYYHMECLIDTHHFAQLDHILSIFMYYLVKNGRNLPEVVEMETQSKFNEAKGLVSYWFARWADKLILTAQIMGKKPDAVPIRTEMIRFEEFMEPGVEIYENQFPTDFIRAIKDLKKVIKKGRLWCQRAVEYHEKCKDLSERYNFQLKKCQTLLKRFDEFYSIC